MIKKFNIINQLHILNQITPNKVLTSKSTNKVLTSKSTNKVSYLNNCLYAPANNQNKTFYIKSIRIKAFNKSYNKTFISYNHFKGSKKAFNYKSYKSIKLVRFWLVDRLKGFKIDISQIVRLKIYKWGLVEIILLISIIKIFEIIMDFNKIILKMILISIYSWSEIKVELYLTNLLKIAEATRFGVYLNLISDWVILPKTAKAPRFGEIFNFISG